jgi:dTDP-4-dehydrorhamnose reductase
MKLLITGAGGQLGLALARRLASEHEVVALVRDQLDISDAEACSRTLDKLRPDLLLNCAAYTAVDRAETDRDTAFAMNADGPRNLARASQELGIFPIHFSTDYVFDGMATTPYDEDAATKPTSVYGESKLAGETAFANASPAHLVFRLSWVYSNDGANFYKTMLRLGSQRSELRVVADQIGVPNYTGDLADAIAGVLGLGRYELAARSGLYHLSAAGPTSWCEFARAIFSGAQMSDRVAVSAISTSEYETAAKRPAYSVLDARRSATTFGIPVLDWRAGLQRCLAERTMST